MQDGTFSSSGYPKETGRRIGNLFDPTCPTRQLLDRIGDRWSVLVLLLLGQEALRFNELKRRIGGISQKMLSQTLRALERDGLVVRSVATTRPVSVTYAITPLGQDLHGTVRILMEWAETHIGSVVEAQSVYDRAQVQGPGT